MRKINFNFLFSRLFLLLVVCTLSVSCQAQQVFKLQLTQSKDSKAVKYYIYLSDDKCELPEMPNDSMLVKKGKCQYSTTVLSLPRPAIVQMVGEDGKPSEVYEQTFFIPGETLVINVEGNKMRLSGSDFYTQSQAFRDVMDPHMLKLKEISDGYRPAVAAAPAEKRDSVSRAIIDSYNKEMAAYKAELDSYVTAHSAEAGVGVTAFAIFKDEGLYSKLSDEVKNGSFKAYLDNTMASLKARREKREAAEKAAEEAKAKSAAGQKFIDFECEYDGKVQKLSDYVGKGQYVLVDFWASWCGPCRQEIPNLINVYNKYKGDRFNVLGVATWDKPDDTKKAMQQLGINYPQMLNAQKAGSDAYGIMGIPQIILFGPDGTILKRDLRGEEIEKAVKECLGSKN